MWIIPINVHNLNSISFLIISHGWFHLHPVSDHFFLATAVQWSTVQVTRKRLPRIRTVLEKSLTHHFHWNDSIYGQLEGSFILRTFAQAHRIYKKGNKNKAGKVFIFPNVSARPWTWTGLSRVGMTQGKGKHPQERVQPLLSDSCPKITIDVNLCETVLGKRGQRGHKMRELLLTT